MWMMICGFTITILVGRESVCWDWGREIELWIIDCRVTWFGGRGCILAKETWGESNWTDEWYGRGCPWYRCSHLNRLLGRAIIWGIQREWFSIALLVRASFNTLLPLLAVRVDAFFSNAILNTTETWACVVTLLASLLTVGACVLDLSALAAGWRSGYDATGERVHVHRHAGVTQRMHSHRRLQIGGLSFIRCLFIGFRGGAIWHLWDSRG